MENRSRDAGCLPFQSLRVLISSELIKAGAVNLVVVPPSLENFCLHILIQGICMWDGRSAP